ncbi:S8 family peptidase [Streptomyces sp. SCA3-4]|uniref:S8 family peptidase n=1 Tax=Streptomyces sichuanensis TaxID=2871810 RepID=UPI001CE2C7FC|nr:S8 family peptidase [Streptomyces sichuanensis]MCA6091688.1 S8 family peptidase [Streptomyces sichuanensis]
MRLPRRSARRYGPAAALLLVLPLVVALAGTPGAPAGPSGPGPGGPRRPAPLRTTTGERVPDHYIVTLRTGTSPRALSGRLGVTPDYVYTHALTGFAATLSAEQLEAVRSTPGVAAVEQDAVLTQAAEAAAPPATRTTGRVGTGSYGLDRIDQRNLPLDSQFNATATGEGATVYVMDTGIDYSHPDFGGRAKNGTDLVSVTGNGSDCRTGSGHGTHVAGLVGGATFGVARKVSLVSVRVLDCGGRTTVAKLIAGFDYVVRSAAPASVVNASISGPSSQAVDTAIGNVAAKGVPPVVAAGNENDNACDHSPAGALAALAVGATDQQDRMTDFSNYGPCTRILAPGADIVSAAMGGGSATRSGTSQASPHVAGVAALYKAKNPTAGSAAVINWIVEQSTKNAAKDLKTGTPNRLLYTGGL